MEGFTNPFAAWNVLPLALAWFVQYRSGQNGRRGWAGFAFALFTTTAVVAAHLAWLLDWGGTATGSSTSALIFVALPIWALLVGSLGGLVGWALGRFVRRSPAG